MTFAAITQQIPIGKNKNFSFPHPISAYAAGISAFKLQYPGNTPRETQQIMTGLTSTKPSANTVNVTVSGDITDGGTIKADPDVSYVKVTVIGWIGAGYEDLIMQSLLSPGTPVNAGKTVVSAESFLAGFDAHFNDWYKVHSVTADTGASILSGGTSINPTGSATITGGGTGSGSVEVGIIGTLNQRPGIKMKSAQLSGWGQITHVSFNKPLKELALFVKNFDIAYDTGENHKVSQFFVDPFYSYSADKKSIQIINISGMDRTGAAGYDGSSVMNVDCLLIYSF